VNVENHHHQNHSDSPASEPLIEHTYDEFRVKLTNMNMYNNYGDLVKVYRDVLIERLSYLLSRGVSAELHILLKDVVVWVRNDCGLWVTEEDIKSTVARYMRGRLEIANDVIHAWSQQLQGEDGWESLKQSGDGNSWWKHGVRQNARIEHERPESIVNVIGSAVGVSVITEVWPTKLNAVAAEFSQGSTSRPKNSSRCAQFIANMGISGGHPARRMAVLIENGQGHRVPVGGGVLLMRSDRKT